MNSNSSERIADSPNASKKEAVGIGIGAAFVTLIAVLCCAGVPALLSFVGAIGLGVLIKKHLLFPLMVASLLLGSWGAYRSWRDHRNNLFLVGYLVNAAAIPAGMKLYHPLMYAGLVGLVGLTGIDLVRKFRKPGVCVTDGIPAPRGKESVDSGCH